MKKSTLWISLIISILLVGLTAFFLIYQILTTYQAHSTFEGYCNWRGLGVLTPPGADYGYCRDAASGQIYKIVEVNNRWYLDGDLPNGWPF